MAIPASNIVSVNPRVIQAGGNDLETNGLLLTRNANLPLASMVMEFTSAAAVGEYFGTDSWEYIAAAKYFAGYTNCFAYPRRMMIARYLDEDAGAEIKGAKYEGKLGDLQAITDGVIELMYNGTAYKFSGIDLSGAASYSDVAGILEANIAEQLEGVTVSYSSLTGGYKINAEYVADTDNELEAVEYEADENENPEPEPEPEPEPDPEPETKYGTLTVSKQVDGESDASAFGFKVEIGDESYEITLDNDEYKSYDGIVAGTEFTVTETDSKGASSVSYTVDEEEPVEGTTVSGVIEGDADTDVTFINAYVEDENPDGDGNPDDENPDDGGDNPDGGDNGNDGDDTDEGTPVAHKAHPVPLAAAEETLNDLAVILSLLSTDGAINSTGSAALSVDDNFKAIREKTDNWISFTTVFTATDEEHMAFTKWAMSQGVQYLYIAWSAEKTLEVQGDETSIASQFDENNVSSVALVHKASDTAAAVMGWIASIDWNRYQGAITLAFKTQDGLEPTVTNETVADVLLSKKVNFYGQYATRNDDHIFFYNGCMFGEYKYIDPYVNAIWLNNALQQAIMNGLKATGRTPYTDRGYTLIRSWMADPISRALYNGVIDEGVTLSEAQKQEVYNETGREISDELYANGYVVIIEDADPTVRANRESPNISLYYCYGGSVHKIVVASTALL